MAYTGGVITTRPQAAPDPLAPSWRKLVPLVAATLVGSCGLGAGGAAGALLGVQLGGSHAHSGVPLGVLVVGSAVGAVLITRLAARFGRIRSLAAGYATGAIGAGVVVLAAATGSFGIMLVGSALLGVANAAVFLTRYAAAAVTAEPQRGRALGLTLFSVAAGAVASPQLLGPAGRLAEAIGLPPLSGMFVIALMSFTLAAGLLASISRDRPASINYSLQAIVAHLRGPRLATAVCVLAVTNLLMVGVMAVVPIGLVEHGHALELIGLVISVHVAGMFVPSPLTGWLADRIGARAVASGGILVLFVAGLGGAIASDAEPSVTVLFLALLGIGWNCGVVGGSALLIAAIPAALRTHGEAFGELVMGLAAAVAAPLAGVMLAGAGMTVVWLAVTVVACLAMPALSQERRFGLR